MNKERKGWCWRDKELTMKEFYRLTQTGRNQYVEMLENLPQQEVSSGDQIILGLYSKKKKIVKEFLVLDE